MRESSKPHHKPPRKGFREYIVDQVKKMSKAALLSEITPKETIQAIEKMSPSNKKKILSHLVSSHSSEADPSVVCDFENCLIILCTEDCLTCTTCSKSFYTVGHYPGGWRTNFQCDDCSPDEDP